MMRRSHTTFRAPNIDYAREMQLLAMFSGQPGEDGNPHVADAIQQIEALGISFDGRQYRYRDYGYDLLADALSYALLEQAGTKHEPTDSHPPVWLEAAKPSADDERLMAELGITFDGRYYCFGGYRYEQLDDACAYARLQH